MDYSQAIDYLDWHYIEKPDYVEPSTEDALAAVKKKVADLRAALEATMTQLRRWRDEKPELWDAIIDSGMMDAWDQARAALAGTEAGDG